MGRCRKIVKNFVHEHVEIALNELKKTYLLPIILWWDLSTEVASVMDGLQLTENVHIWSTIHLDCKVRSCTVITCSIFQFQVTTTTSLSNGQIANQLLVRLLNRILTWPSIGIFLSTNLRVKTNGLAWVAKPKIDSPQGLFCSFC